MARKEREGFVLYHDIAMNQLQYLTADDFRDVVMAAVAYSIALAKGETEPHETRFTGLADGAYKSLCSSARRSAVRYWKSACRAKINRNKQDKKELAQKDIGTLTKFGYNRRDIAYIKDLSEEELAPYFTSGDSTSPAVTGGDKLNRPEQIGTNLEPDIDQTGNTTTTTSGSHEGEAPTGKDKAERLRREIDGMKHDDAMRHLMNNGLEFKQSQDFISEMFGGE